MKKSELVHLSRRERQIMDILFREGEVAAQEVKDNLPDPPSYSAVRALLRILVDKGHVTFRREGNRYIYRPTQPREQAKRSAVSHLIRTFFDGSVENAMAALIGMNADDLDEGELDRLEQLIEHTRRRRDQ
jgi:predicted transcriptional regulator